jgi:hypothetical protein
MLAAGRRSRARCTVLVRTTVAAAARSPSVGVTIGCARWQRRAPLVLLVPVALAVGSSPLAERRRQATVECRSLERSRPAVLRLSSLFALGSFSGRFCLAFIAYWLRAASMPPGRDRADVLRHRHSANRLVPHRPSVDRYRLLRHDGVRICHQSPPRPSPSRPRSVKRSCCLAAVLSEMDVLPARPVMVLVDTGGAAPAPLTFTARYVTRPLGTIGGHRYHRSPSASPRHRGGIRPPRPHHCK